MAEITQCPPAIELWETTFSYSSSPVVSDFSFRAQKGELVVIMGPSGCGKSTLLRLISGLELADEGKCLVNGKIIAGPQREVFYGFQDYDAFPWLTVEGNVRLAISFQGAKRRGRSIDDILQMVGLDHARYKLPAELSGGMRKRLSFARCLGSGASIVLLDEPFASLDVKARSDMQRLVHETLSETRGLAILVTHDVDEAVFLASRIMICKGPPLEVIKDIELTFPLPRAESFRVTEDFEKVCAGVRALLNREKA